MLILTLNYPRHASVNEACGNPTILSCILTEKDAVKSTLKRLNKLQK